MSSTRLIHLLKANRLRIFTTGTAATLLCVSRSAASQLLERMTRARLVLRLKQGVWVNLTAPAFRPEEAVPYLTFPWPSYVSLHSALSEHGLISEIPQLIYAVSGGRPCRFDTPLGRIQVHHLPSHALWGFEMHPSGDGSFPLATPEKAYLDTLYLASIPRSPIRMPPFRHRPQWDRKRLGKYLARWKLKDLL